MMPDERRDDEERRNPKPKRGVAAVDPWEHHGTSQIDIYQAGFLIFSPARVMIARGHFV